jgi:RNA polymerase sigma factor (sigma-70 family)
VLVAHPLLSILFAPSSADDGDTPRSWRAQREKAIADGDRVPLADPFIEGIRAGAPAAFEALFRAEYATLLDVAAGWSGALDHAAEIVSDVFVWLYEHHATVAPRTSLTAYLVGAVRHRAMNLRRGAARALVRHTTLAAETHEAVVPSAERTPEEVYLADEQTILRTRRLVRALEGLSQLARSVFLLRLQRDMSYAEIGEALGVSPNAAKTQFSRTLAAVRRTLAADAG